MTVVVPHLRRLIRRRNHHLVDALGAVSGTEPGLAVWPVDESSPYRRSEVSAEIGRGDEVWERASRDVLLWRVKTRSGFRVPDGRAVTPGAELEISARIAGVSVREPVQVVEVVSTPTRVGFSYRTLPGHPVSRSSRGGGTSARCGKARVGRILGKDPRTRPPATTGGRSAASPVVEQVIVPRRDLPL